MVADHHAGVVHQRQVLRLGAHAGAEAGAYAEAGLRVDGTGGDFDGVGAPHRILPLHRQLVAQAGGFDDDGQGVARIGLHDGGAEAVGGSELLRRDLLEGLLPRQQAHRHGA